MPSVVRTLKAVALPCALLAALEIHGRWAVAHGSEALAPPSAAARAFAGALLDGSLWDGTMFTLGSAALGLAIGFALALSVGFVLGLSRRAAWLSSLTVEVLRPVPAVALIPLSMLMFGFGLRMELAVVAFATFWPMLILVQVAVQQVDGRLLEVGRVLGLSPVAMAWKILLPAIVPRLFVALRAGVGIALVVAVTVEVAANPNGMGYAMMIAQQSFDPALMLAWLGWIGVVGFVLNGVMLRLQGAVARRMGAAE